MPYFVAKRQDLCYNKLYISTNFLFLNSDHIKSLSETKENKMNVLSLFDGIGCGYLALKKAGIQVDKYYASEIEPHAIKVATTNNPDIIELGDVTKVSYNDGILYTENATYEVGRIDLVCGGSPCTNFSSIGYANGMVSGDIEILSLEQYLQLKSSGVTFDGQSYLFWEFCRILKEVNPQYYLLENVVMAKKWETIITNALGVQPIRINSSLMSAQNRPRLYWTNIQGIQLPEDKNIILDDILIENPDSHDVSYCLTVQRSFPRMMKKYGHIPSRFNAYNASIIKDKACALSRGSMITSSCATLLFVEDENGIHKVKHGVLNGEYPTNLSDGKYNVRKLDMTEIERLQNLPDGYTNVSSVPTQKRVEMIGNGWTVDVIAHIFSFIKV